MKSYTLLGHRKHIPIRNVYRVYTKDGLRNLCDFHIARSRPPVVRRGERLDYLTDCEECKR